MSDREQEFIPNDYHVNRHGSTLGIARTGCRYTSQKHTIPRDERAPRDLPEHRARRQRHSIAKPFRTKARSQDHS